MHVRDVREILAISLKLIALPYLRDKHKKSFIGIGVGSDAIAGIIPNTELYFDDLANYRLRNYDYSISYPAGVNKTVENIC